MTAVRLPRGHYLLLALGNDLPVRPFLLLRAALQNGQKPFSVLAGLGRRVVISTIAIIAALLLCMDQLLILVKRGAAAAVCIGGSVEQLLGGVAI